MHGQVSQLLETCKKAVAGLGNITLQQPTALQAAASSSASAALSSCNQLLTAALLHQRLVHTVYPVPVGRLSEVTKLHQLRHLQLLADSL